jgi:hypothetical protein
MTMTAIDWRKRNAAVEAALREYLASVPRGTVLSTQALAEALHAKAFPFTAGLNEKSLGSVLTKLAPWMGVHATHDGEKFFAYGRQNVRWRWHGQAA